MKPSRPRQLLFDLAMGIPRGNALTSLSFELAMSLVRARGERVLVEYRLGDRKLLIPAAHDLPRYRRYDSDYGENLRRVGATVHGKYPSLAVVDVGANVGDSALMLRGDGPVPLLCVEGDVWFARLLRHNVGGLDGVEIEEAFVGPASAEMAVSRRSEGGSTWLLPGEGGQEQIRFTTLGPLLDRHPRFAGSKLLKIDTDGFDCDIIKSEQAVLADLRPVLFFEYAPDMYRDPRAAFEAFRSLRDAGYRTVLAYLNHGEFLVAADLDDGALLEDLHAFVTGHAAYGQPSPRYLDLCAFHAEDADVHRAARDREHAQSRRVG
jgi:FkbM family methyltransferase